MKLVNKDAGMTIGVVWMRGNDAIEPGWWLYSQVGRERILHARMNNNSTARRLLQTLVDWDAAGGNDGGVEE